MGEKSLDLWNAHAPWMAFVVEQDVALDPGDVGFLSADGIMLEAYGLANAV